MRTSKFTPEQMVMALRQAEAGTSIEDVCRKLGISEATFHRWKKRLGEASESLRYASWPAAARREPPAEVGGGRPDRGQGRAAGRPNEKKMVRPGPSGVEVVAWARSAYQLSERRGMSGGGRERVLRPLPSRRPRTQGRRCAGGCVSWRALRVRAGYRQLHVYLRREGWRVNRKRVYRLYGLEGLVLKMKRPRRHRSATVRIGRAMATTRRAVGHGLHARHAGRSVTIRILTAIDLFSRECVALVASRSFSGDQVAEILNEAKRTRGPLPETLRVDNGTEFTWKDLDHWAYWNRVRLDFSRPRKPATIASPKPSMEA